MVLVQYVKKFFVCWLISIFLSGLYTQRAGAVAPPFLPGEYLEYQVYYSFVHAGTATMCVDKQLHKVNDHLCYKIEVKGVSSNALGLLGFKVLDRWESYLEADLAHGLRPYRCLVHIQENGYVKKEQIDFDYASNQARVAVTESIHNMEPEVTYHPLCSVQAIKDLISGYYSLRATDATKLKPGDKLTITVLHDRQIYKDIEILFLGRKTIETKFGKTSALVFAPLVPDIEDSIFSGTRPVEAYISDDANKVPLKLKVNLVVGSVEIALTDYKGLKEQIHFKKG